MTNNFVGYMAFFKRPVNERGKKKIEDFVTNESEISGKYSGFLIRPEEVESQ